MPLGEAPFWLGMSGVLGVEGQDIPDDIPQSFTTELGSYCGLQPTVHVKGNKRVNYQFD